MADSSRSKHETSAAECCADPCRGADQERVSPRPAFEWSGPILVEAIHLHLRRARLLFGLELLGTLAMLATFFAAPLIFDARYAGASSGLATYFFSILACGIGLNIWVLRTKEHGRRELEQYRRQLQEIELTKLAMQAVTSPSECSRLIRGLKAALNMNEGKPAVEKRRVPKKRRSGGGRGEVLHMKRGRFFRSKSPATLGDHSALLLQFPGPSSRGR